MNEKRQMTAIQLTQSALFTILTYISTVLQAIQKLEEIESHLQDDLKYHHK
jgi:hypothetical protein